MSDNWWARKLGQYVTPAPNGSAPITAPQKAVRWRESYPPTGPCQEVVDDQPGGYGDDNWQRVQRQGFIDKAPGSVGHTGKCPKCNGSNYFRRRWAHTECAPLCTDCGYNGDLWEQSGSLLNAVGLKSSGPTQTARTDNPFGEGHLGVDPGVSSDFSWSNVR